MKHANSDALAGTEPVQRRSGSKENCAEPRGGDIGSCSRSVAVVNEIADGVEHALNVRNKIRIVNVSRNSFRLSRNGGGVVIRMAVDHPNKRSILQERIQARLDATRRSPRDVSLKAGLGADAIRTILNGRSKSPRGDTLKALADELQCDVGYLLGEIDKPYAHEALRRNKFGTVRGVDKMIALFQVSGDWLPEVMLGDDEQFPITNLYSLPDYLTGYQHIELVADNHAGAFAPKGSALHVLSLHNRLLIKDGDVVIVERQSLDASQETIVQRACRRYRKLSEKIALLEPVTTEWREPPLRLEGPTLRVSSGEHVFANGEVISISALVLRVIVSVGGPPIVTGEQPHRDPARHPIEE